MMSTLCPLLALPDSSRQEFLFGIDSPPAAGKGNTVSLTQRTVRVALTDNNLLFCYLPNP